MEFINGIQEVLRSFSQMVSDAVFPPLEKGLDKVMDNVEERIIVIEKRLTRRLVTGITITFGGILLVAGLLTYLREFLGWSGTAAFFSIGAMVLIIGLILKIAEKR